MYYGLNMCIEYAIMHVCRVLFVCISICLFIYLMYAHLSVFLYICLSVRMYVCQSSVCLYITGRQTYMYVCLFYLPLSIHRPVHMPYRVLGRVPIYFSLCVVHCYNPILVSYP